jgi:PP-loop superfamily ATP-utilizing enzyme
MCSTLLRYANKIEKPLTVLRHAFETSIRTRRFEPVSRLDAFLARLVCAWQRRSVKYLDVADHERERDYLHDPDHRYSHAHGAISMDFVGEIS